MPTKCKVIFDEDTKKPIKLITPYYTVSHGGFDTLVRYAATNLSIPTDRSFNVGQGIAERAANIYIAVRFYHAFNRLNELTYVNVYQAHKELLKPILDNLDTLKKLKLIEYDSSVSQILGKSVHLYDTYRDIDSWGFTKSVNMPIKLPYVRGLLEITRKDYPHLTTKPYLPIVEKWKNNINSLVNMQKKFTEKITNHKHHILHKILNVNSTSNLILRATPSDESAEYNSMRLALDLSKTLADSTYGAGTKHSFYNDIGLDTIYKDNNIAVELDIKCNFTPPTVHINRDNIVINLHQESA